VIKQNTPDTAWFKSAWDGKGKKFAAGSIDGTVSVWQCSDPKIVAPKSLNDEETAFHNTIKRLEPMKRENDY